MSVRGDEGIEACLKGVWDVWLGGWGRRARVGRGGIGQVSFLILIRFIHRVAAFRVTRIMKTLFGTMNLAVLLSVLSFPDFPAMASGPHPGNQNKMRNEFRFMVDDLNALRGKPPRSISGVGNNVAHPDWGAAPAVFLRVSPPRYEDGVQAPSGADRPNPRTLSNTVADQPASVLNSKGVSDMFWQWGQFLDHDITLAPLIDPLEPFNIPVPQGDPLFDPFATGTQVIPLQRTLYVMVNGVREQVNVNTAYVDASQVYGSDDARALELRTLDGTGRLKMSEGNFLPFNVNGFFNFPVNDDPSFYLAGDVRVTEQVGLISIHTLFAREHNMLAGALREALSDASGEEIYQLARRLVIAEMQQVTYHEFLPLLLGPGALGEYRGYRPEVNAGIATEFSTAAYRVGHTLLSPQLQRLNKNRTSIADGPLALRDAFFSVDTFVNSGGPDTFLRGLTAQTAQQVDAFVISDVRNFLFGPPGAGGFDLPSLNIQRGRDHGLGTYNEIRVAYGLAPQTSFAQVTSDPVVQQRLALAYGSVEDIDPWVGCLAEDHFQSAMVGETIYAIAREQFIRLRDGDRFYYENDLPPHLLAFVKSETLSDIIRRNTRIAKEIPDRAMEHPWLP